MDFKKENIRWLKDYYGNPSAYLQIKTPSVSAILEQIPDPEWEQFIKDVGEEKALKISKDAQDRGKSMHAFIETFIKEFAKTNDPSHALQQAQTITPKFLLENENVPLEKIDKGREMFLNFYYSKYANVYKDLIGSELFLYSPTLFYRGKTDVFYKELNNKLVTDFKTSSKLIEKGSVKERKYKLQLGGYVYALEDMLKEQSVTINKASILVIQTKSTNIQEIFVEGDELEKQKEEFKNLVKQFHINNNQGFLTDDRN
jgi:hypothetical protein